MLQNREHIVKIFVLLILGLLAACNCKSRKNEMRQAGHPVKVKLVQTDGKYLLLLNQKPYYINGAGASYEKLHELAENGGNSCRNWSTEGHGYSTHEYLDKAYENNLTVTLGLNVGKERHGFDYNDTAAVQNQLEHLREEVIKYKDHPALIVWGIGNELNLNYSNPLVWDAVNNISKMIHQLDPNHLTTTMLAGINKKEVDLIAKRCPDIDFLSIQLYGAIEYLEKYINNSGYKGPYLVTEWGATGHWEVPKTSWGVPIEQTSHEKSLSYIKRYTNIIRADSMHCMGSYVFYWGQKQERTPTWYGLFTEYGKPTEVVDAMHFLWNSTWPKNRAPILDSLHLNGLSAYQNVKLTKNMEYDAEVFVHDFEDNQLTYDWELLYESTELGIGGDPENKPEDINKLITNNNKHKITIIAPKKAGAYRLFIYVSDNQKSATANIPFYVDE